MLLDQCVALVAQAKLFVAESADTYTTSDETQESARVLEKVDSVGMVVCSPFV